MGLGHCDSGRGLDLRGRGLRLLYHNGGLSCVL